MKKKFLAIHEGKEIIFYLEQTPDKGAVISINDEKTELDIRSAGAHNYSLISQNQSWTVSVVRQKDDVQIVSRGQSVAFKLLNEKKIRRAGGEGASHGAASGEVTSPMPGKIVKIQVEAGQQVRTGDGLVVVEAMKMENEFKAPRDGMVKALKVKVGDSVESGAVMVIIG